MGEFIMVRSAVCAVAILVFSSVSAQSTTPSVSIEGIEIQKVGSDCYFRVSIAWPSEDAPANYAEFARPEGRLSFLAYWWPHDSLALIPQSASAYRVCRAAPERGADDGRFDRYHSAITLPSPAVFVGKLRDIGEQEFLLRCPQSGGTWQYLPVSIDFSKAKSGESLAEQWLQSQALALETYAGTNSFFAYARNRLLARVGKAATSEPSDPREPLVMPPASSEDLYEVTTGALAMQESLQLDRMLNSNRDTGPREVPLARIKGVTVRSHPWEEMIGAKQPEIEPIAGLVPEDQYYVRFTTTRGLSEFLEFSDAWGESLLGMTETDGRDYGVKERIETQICLRTSRLSHLLGPAVIESLVVTGSDPYLREGSDLTVIFRLKAAPLFEAGVGRYLEEARKQRRDVREGTEEYEGVAIQYLITPDQVIRCYRARIDEYYLYSNSPVAVRRAIDAYRGKRPSLAKSMDFHYIRTLYPLGDQQEDGLVFLSDPFIRALVGPRIRIAEKRRIEAITSMEMVKNAALLYLWETPGQKVPTLEQLYDKGYLDRKHIQVEAGDSISWDTATFTATSERYGRTGYLTPILELPLDKVTAQEEADYGRFRDLYQDYWRQYFDPIGIRVTAGRDIALSVTILPLIDNSRYNQMQSFVGGQQVDLSVPAAARAAAIYASSHLNPESPDLKSTQNVSLSMLPGAPRTAVEWMGERLVFWIEDAQALAEAARTHAFEAIFRIPIVLGVEVKNPLGLAAMLVGAQASLRTSAPDMLAFEPTEPYREHTFTRIGMTAQGQQMGMDKMEDAALYYGSVGGFFYLSTSLKSLHGIVDSGLPMASETQATRGAGSAAPGAPTTQAVRKGHLALRLNLADTESAKALAAFCLGPMAQMAEATHCRNLHLLAETVGLGDNALATPQQVLGYSIRSSLGNTYHYDGTHDEVVGSVTGSEWALCKQQAIPDESPLGRLVRSLRSLSAQLSFTEEGLCSDLRIERR